MPGWRWCRGRYGSKGRPHIPLFLSQIPNVKEFIPTPCLNPQPIQMSYPEYEALRLVDLEGLTQEEAAEKMNTSRGTVWRLLESGRRKVIQAISEGRPLVILPQGEIDRVK